MATIPQMIQVLKDANLLIDHNDFSKDETIEALVTDSRQEQANSAFLAIKGESFDAHLVLDNIAAKFKLIIVEDDRHFKRNSSPPRILVNSTRSAWSHLEALLAGHPERDLNLWAVTGTNGKTSSVWLIRGLLHSMGEKVLMMGTIGNYLGDHLLPTHHTTPDPNILFPLLAKAKANGIKHVAMEVSSHALAQAKLGPIKFQGALFTSFSRDHLDFHGSMKEYFATKLTLFDQHVKQGAAMVAHESIRQAFPEYGISSTPGLRYYGAEKDAQYQYKISDSNLAKTDFQVTSDSQIDDFQSSLCGEFIISNLVGCLALLDSLLPRDPSQRKRLVKGLQPVPGRLEVLPKIPGCPTVIVDYAHTPDALEACIRAVRPLLDGTLILVFGCGGDRDKGKRALMGKVASLSSDRTIITSDNPRSESPEQIIADIVSGWSTERDFKTMVNREQAIEYAINTASDGDCVVIAGKGHEDYQIIKNRRLSFDDRLVAQKYMSTKTEAN